MLPERRFFLAWVALAWFAAQAARADGSCLPYEPKSVTLSGVVRREEFSGRPNYEDVKSGDELEVYWILELTSPICVDQDPTSGGLNDEVESVSRVQLVLTGDQYKQYRSLINSRFRALGSLYGAIGAHHKTPVLLTVDTLEALK